MRAILMGKHKRSAVSALEHLLRRGVEVVAVVAPPDPGGAADSQRLDRLAQLNGIEVATDDELYARIERGELADVDLVLSFLFWKRLRAPLIELGRIGCLNFHPAPLPDMRGMGGFNVAILEGFAEWGVSGHFVDAGLRHRRPGAGGPLPDRSPTPRPCRWTWRARCGCWRCSRTWSTWPWTAPSCPARPRARAAT